MKKPSLSRTSDFFSPSAAAFPLRAHFVFHLQSVRMALSVQCVGLTGDTHTHGVEAKKKTG